MLYTVPWYHVRSDPDLNGGHLHPSSEFLTQESGNWGLLMYPGAGIQDASRICMYPVIINKSLNFDMLQSSTSRYGGKLGRQSSNKKKN